MSICFPLLTVYCYRFVLRAGLDLVCLTLCFGRQGGTCFVLPAASPRVRINLKEEYVVNDNYITQPPPQLNFFCFSSCNWTREALQEIKMKGWLQLKLWSVGSKQAEMWQHGCTASKPSGSTTLTAATIIKSFISDKFTLSWGSYSELSAKWHWYRSM